MLSAYRIATSERFESVEYDRAIPVNENAVVDVPAHRAREYDLLQVAALFQQVFQSVAVPARRPPKVEDAFQVCAMAHLRAVKDPLLPARAVRLLPESSRIRLVLLGGSLDDSLRADAEREQRENPRFRWLGERPRSEALEVLARSHIFVSSSRHEGGSNVISEAIALGLPILATAVPGSLGLLGDAHPGLYPVGDAPKLAELLLRAESDPRYLASLERHSLALAGLTDPARERESWRALLAEVAG